MSKLKQKITDIYKYIRSIVRTKEMSLLPGHLSYYLLLSIIPLIYIIWFFGTLFLNNNYDMLELINSVIPGNIEQVLGGLLSYNKLSISNVIFLITILYIASGGFSRMIVSSNVLYGIRPRNYVLRRAKGFILTIILLVLLFFLIVINIIVASLFTYLIDISNVDNILGNIDMIFRIAKIFVSIIIIFILLKTIYIVAPDKRIKSSTVNFGTIIASIGIYISTEVYSFYALNYATYDKIYGNLSNIIVLFIWVYIIAYIFVFGMIINYKNYIEYNKTEE